MFSTYGKDTSTARESNVYRSLGLRRSPASLHVKMLYIQLVLRLVVQQIHDKFNRTGGIWA